MTEWTLLPLYEDWDYEYTTVLEDTSYTLRLTYSERTESWTLGVSLEQGEVIVEGESIRIRDALYLKGQDFLSGMFWLEPQGVEANETNLHPSLISKYFNFYYGYEKED